jgi:6-phosphogluconolactonase (cycloisomerase 2 family)
VLYVLTECIDTLGYLTAFKVDPATGAVAQLGERISMTGRSTCYISFDQEASHALITNYWCVCVCLSCSCVFLVCACMAG